MLNVKSVSFSYGKREVLHDISFSVPDDSVVSILGPNGVGKTTLLNCICNIHKPQGGTIDVDGVGVMELRGKEMARNIGYVPQSPSRSRMTVFDSVLLGRKPYFELNAKEEDTRLVAEILADMHMEKLALRYATEISGGEFQKMQIARALVQKPKVLVLDEPANNLDLTNQHMVMSLIRKISKEKKISALLTMHDINLAAAYSDILIFMNNGEIDTCGGTEVVTPELVKRIYNIDVDVIYHKGATVIIPDIRRSRGGS